MTKPTAFQRYCDEFAEDVIGRIKAGTAPWQKPWQPGEYREPVSVQTGKTYNGANVARLVMAGFGDPRWITFKQAKKHGGYVRKGERGTPAFFWKVGGFKPATHEDGAPVLDDKGQPMSEIKRPFFRTYNVFNVSQCDGLDIGDAEDPEIAKLSEWELLEAAEQALDATGIERRHVEGDRAYYNMNRDEIVLPLPGQFPNPLAYYQTAFHECIHATGHAERLNRSTLIEGIGDGFGSPTYAREELRAEIGAMMAGGMLGIGSNPDRGAAYVEGWLAALEEDTREIYRAARDAAKAVTWIADPASRAKATQEAAKAA